MSNCINVACRVPQGSVINELPRLSSILTFYLFADDINIYYGSKNLDMLQRIINKELKKVQIWLDVNKRSLNIDKTNLIILSLLSFLSLMLSVSKLETFQSGKPVKSNFLVFSWMKTFLGNIT